MFIMFICGVIVAFMPYVAHWVVIQEKRKLGTYNQQLPREQTALLRGRGQRAWAAEQNAFEFIGPFSIVFFLALFSNLHGTGLAALMILIVVARFIHLLAYVTDRPSWRSGAFGVCMICLILVVGMSFYTVSANMPPSF